MVCGPDGVDDVRRQAGRVPVVALSLRPLGGRFAEALPTGVDGLRRRGAGPARRVRGLRPARGRRRGLAATVGSTQAELLAQAAGAAVVAAGGRLLTDVNPCTADGAGHAARPARSPAAGTVLGAAPRRGRLGGARATRSAPTGTCCRPADGTRRSAGEVEAAQAGAEQPPGRQPGARAGQQPQRAGGRVADQRSGRPSPVDVARRPTSQS